MARNNDGFYISIPENIFSKNFKIGILAILIAIVLVFSVVTRFNVATVLVIITLTILIMIIMHSSRGPNYVGSLPDTTYPIPPHLGLDGISLANMSRL